MKDLLKLINDKKLELACLERAKIRIEQLEAEVSQLVKQRTELNFIDTGIGKIYYLIPDNMKCQTYMENLKTELERDGI